MKVATQPVDIEKSADFESIKMGIGNEVMIMEFLRNKLYSNKIGIVVQEYMSNARDAHREVGTPTLPIEVTVPTKLKPEFRVRDFGPGIDHERMEGAFAQYGISTKNQDNEATGGFGIGCMSGFSYSDNFTVIVVLEDREIEDFLQFYIDDLGISMDILIEDGWIDSNRTRRQYICYIDESRAGSIDLVDEAPTDERVGTTIIIPCKKGDMREFSEQVVRVTQWWNKVPNSARPIITNKSHFHWPNYPLSYFNSEARWAIQKKRNYYGEDPQDAPFAILDGIPYPVDLASIYPRRDMEEKSTSIFDGEDEEEKSPIPDYASALFSVPLRMMFNTGEVNVAVSREALDYGTETRRKLRDRIKQIHKSICDIIDSRIIDANNLWEACSQWRKIKDEFEFIEVAAEWEGYKLFSVMEVPTQKPYGKSAADTTALWTYRWSNGDEEFCLEKNSGHNSWSNAEIKPSEDVWLVEDDTEFTRPPKSKMRTVMNLIPEDRRSVVRVKVVKFRKAKDKDKMEEDYNWSALSPIVLSEIEKTVKVRPKQPRAKAVKVKMINDESYSFKEAEIDFLHGGGVYVAQYKGRFITDPENFRPDKDFDKCILKGEDTLRSFCNRWNIKIYSVLERYVKKLGPDWEPFADFARRKLQEEAAQPGVAEIFDLDPSFNADTTRQTDYLSIFWSNYRNGARADWVEQLGDPVLKEWLETTVRYNDASHTARNLRREFKRWGIPLKDTHDLADLWRDLRERYGTSLRYIATCPSSFAYEERNRSEEIVNEYYKFFIKYLNLVEIESHLGVKR